MVTKVHREFLMFGSTSYVTDDVGCLDVGAHDWLPQPYRQDSVLWVTNLVQPIFPSCVAVDTADHG